MTHETINEGAQQAAVQDSGESVTQTGSIRNLGTIEQNTAHKIAYILQSGRHTTVMRRVSHRETGSSVAPFKAPIKPDSFHDVVPENLTGGVIFEPQRTGEIEA